jgi:hypothetical protein
MSDFWQQYEAWEKAQIAAFRKTFPNLKPDRIEVCEDGKVFAHLANNAYPIILEGFEAWETTNNQKQG